MRNAERDVRREAAKIACFDETKLGLRLLDLAIFEYERDPAQNLRRLLNGINADYLEREKQIADVTRAKLASIRPTLTASPRFQSPTPQPSVNA